MQGYSPSCAAAEAQGGATWVPRAVLGRHGAIQPQGDTQVSAGGSSLLAREFIRLGHLLGRRLETQSVHLLIKNRKEMEHFESH